MPLKLSIASSRKIGEQNYGSRGATVGLEMEVDSSLVDQPRQLHERIRRMFRLAKQSVNQELGCVNGLGATSQDGSTIVRPATRRQIRAIQVIADRRNLDLSAELQARFRVDRVEDLSLEEASQLITEVDASSNGAMSQA